MKIGTYTKTIVAVVGAVVYALQAAITDGVITNAEIGGLVVVALVALGVNQLPNTPPTKTATARK